MEDTPMEQQYIAGKFKLYEEQEMTDLLCKMKAAVPSYARIMRVMRQFHVNSITAGKFKSNTRVNLEKRMAELGLKCRCIRCREIGLSKALDLEKPELLVDEYESSSGKEYFISFETKHHLFGLCRARIPSKPFRKEITSKSLIIRELHVYGQQVSLESDEAGEAQHKGLGKKLMLKAEEIAKQNSCEKIVVISGVGVKEYYRNKFGYSDDGPYVSKTLQKHNR
tara:strand:- start:72 stop:743 length:672 start_codon:yes stop_codon:yes gene_type:complete